MRKRGLVYQSLSNRLFPVFLTIISISVSTLLIIGIYKINLNVKKSFMHTISGTDIIAGARTSPENLLLFSVFDIGTPTLSVNNSSYLNYAYDTDVAWTFPWTMGDSHHGFRVVGTNNDCFNFLEYSISV